MVGDLKVSGGKVISIHDGSGGRETWEIIKKLILGRVPKHLWKTVDGVGLDELDDGAAIKIGDKYVVIAIDSHTVSPIKFPGGDLGKLAASGTINDVLMMGGIPIAMSDAIIVEEGTPMSLVEDVIDSFVSVASDCDVAVIGGDFKVMPKGSLDKMIITTVGIGIADTLIVDSNVQPGDRIVVTDSVGRHGSTIMAAQLNMLDKIAGLESDVKPLKKYYGSDTKGV